MKYNTYFIASLLLFPALYPQEINPDDYRNRVINAVRLSSPIHIDGLLEESLYQTQKYTNFIQSDPDNGKPASERTEFWVGYDDKAIYVGARCWDSQPDSIVGRMGRRDNLGNSDEFQIAIDAYNDNRSAFFFVINPVGTVADGTISNDSWFDDTWDGIWDGKTKVDQYGWTAEMRIPFSQIRFPKQDVYTWGFEVGREIQRRSEHSLYSYFARDESGFVSKFATLKGIENIQPPRRLEFIPYATAGTRLVTSESGNPFYYVLDSFGRTGGDIKIGLGSSFTIDATVNPDFGQVESDPATLNLSDFETIYGEKRPFFVEGSSIFSFGSGGPSSRWGFNFSEPDFFYSRRVGRPPHGWVDSGGWIKSPANTSILSAAKLSGKVGNDLSVGAFSAITQREFATVDEDSIRFEYEVEPATLFNVARSLKEFDDGRHGIGFIYTRVDRNFDANYLTDILADYSTAYGIDAWTFIGKERDWAVSGWIGRSEVHGSKSFMRDLQYYPQHYFQKPDAPHVEVDTSLTKLTGNAARFFLNKENGNVTLNASLGYLEPSFNSNDLGLTFRTDRLNKTIVFGYNWRDPGKIFRNANLHAASSSNHNFDGEKINDMYFFFGGGQFLNYWRLHFFSGWGPNTLSDTHLRGGPLVISPDGYFFDINFGSDYRKNVSYGGGYNMGDSPVGMHSEEIEFWTHMKIGTRFSITVEPEYSWGVNPAQYVMEIDDSTKVDMYGKRYIVAQLDNKRLSASVRMDLTLNPKLSIQTYIQPYITNGYYSDYKEFEKPRTFDFIHYDDTGERILYDDNTGEYYIGNEGNHEVDTQYRYSSFIANTVLRWEFRPGSTLYFVWTRNSNEYLTSGNLGLEDGWSDLSSLTPENLFALKFSYWFDM